MKRARFARPGELLAVFGSADLVGGARVVFDIGGNKYRLIPDVNYGSGRIYVRAVLTHEEYARIDVRTLKRRKKQVLAGRYRTTSRTSCGATAGARLAGGGLDMAKLLDARKPRVLRNNREYDAAVAELDGLLDQDPKEGTEEFDRLEMLSVLIAAYDDEHHDLPDASPQEAVEFLLEQRGLTRADLTKVLGGRSRVSEFFSGKRKLSLNQARALRELFGIPLDLLV